MAERVRPKFFKGETLEQQYRYMRVYPARRILHGYYGDRLVHRKEMGALMGGDYPSSSVQAHWDELEVYVPEPEPPKPPRWAQPQLPDMPQPSLERLMLAAQL